MPWPETRVEDQRAMLMAAVERGELTMRAACYAAGVSPKTGYKWRARWRSEGVLGLLDRSRAPQRHPNATSAELTAIIVAWRQAHPQHGPKTILTYLQRLQPSTSWPSPSTIGAILVRAGLIADKPKPKASARGGTSFGLAHCDRANAVWSVDFKGWFCLADGQRCEPLTLLDGYSRFLLCLEALRSTKQSGAQPALETAFGEYGLPAVLRSDNGPPFGGGLGRLSKLSVWLLSLGVRPEWIEPGRPQQNGRLERFHRTLKAELLGQVGADLAQQQASFDVYRREYNEQRPHQALAQRTPAEVYERSPRELPTRRSEPVYPDGYALRRVKHCGAIKWQGAPLFVSEALVLQTVGLEPLGDVTNRYWQLWYRDYPVAVLDNAHRTWLTAREAEPVLRRRQPGAMMDQLSPM